MGTTGLDNRSSRDRTAQECRIGVAIGEQVDGTALRVVHRRKIIVGDAVPFQEGADKHLKAGTGWADHHTLSFELGQRLNPRILLGNKHGHVRRQGHDRSNVVLLVPGRFATGGKIADGGIGECQLQFAIGQPANVRLRAFRAFGLNFPVVVSLLLIEHFRDGPTHDIKGPTDWSSSHAQEGPSSCRSTGRPARSARRVTTAASVEREQCDQQQDPG